MTVRIEKRGKGKRRGRRGGAVGKIDPNMNIKIDIEVFVNSQSVPSTPRLSLGGIH